LSANGPGNIVVLSHTDSRFACYVRTDALAVAESAVSIMTDLYMYRTDYCCSIHSTNKLVHLRPTFYTFRSPALTAPHGMMLVHWLTRAGLLYLDGCPSICPTDVKNVLRLFILATFLRF